jgi:hypothetical protein
MTNRVGGFDTSVVRIVLAADVQSICNRVLRSPGLVLDVGRAHNKVASTDLYPIDTWDRIEVEMLTVRDIVTPEDGLSVFRADQGLLSAVLRNRNPWKERVSGDPFDIDADLQGYVNSIISSRFGPKSLYRVCAEAVMLQSFPSKGMSSGLTTNGFHFDREDAVSVRIGLNLGDVPRKVFYVPFSKSSILAEIPEHDRLNPYAAISKLGLPALSVQIEPGEGWTLPTTEYLHDGRRAIPDGFSSFILFRAVKLES